MATNAAAMAPFAVIGTCWRIDAGRDKEPPPFCRQITVGDKEEPWLCRVDTTERNWLVIIGMSKQNSRKLPSSASADKLAAEADLALGLGRFKEAMELYKQLLKLEVRPEWRDGLATAYLGRAKALAAKGLFKEAEIVIGNAVALDGVVKEPLFLIDCLIRQGEIEKALAQALKYIGAETVDPREGRLLAEFAAALCLARPLALEARAGDPPARVEWIAAAKAARAALAGLTGRKPANEIEALLSEIPARSPFGPVRLIVRGLLTEDPAKARRLFDGVPPTSAFGPLRVAAEAALPGEPAEVVGRLNAASAAQRACALEWLGGSAAGPSTLTRLFEAERAGPGALFSLLSKPGTAFPAADARNACFNLLPRIPDRIVAFEKAFGTLSEAEKSRVLALAAEAKPDWRRAVTHWRATAEQLAMDGTREGPLSAGVIYRHLAELAVQHRGIAGDAHFDSPVVFYLRKSLDCDPDYLPAALQLIKLYREDGKDKDWHALADEAARRFPTESAALLQAIESAAARKAYKKAAGFAKQLLAVDPINRPARQRMIELQISQARKQMRSKRPDLARKELLAAGEWERADAPNADLRINLGLVGLLGGQDAEAETRLREGVDLAGGGAVGWFRAALQDAMLTTPQHRPTAPIADELARHLKGVPAKPDIVAIAGLLAAPDVRADRKATSQLGWEFGSWLREATHVAFSIAEFHIVADAILNAQLFRVLGEFAVAGKRREPKERLWRFYEIVARTDNNPGWMHLDEEDEIDDLCESLDIAKDRHVRSRIDRYLENSGDDPASKRRAKRLENRVSDDDSDMFEALFKTFLNSMTPRDIVKLVGTRGREGAVKSLADRFAELPFGAAMPRSMLETMARTIVAVALGEAPTL